MALAIEHAEIATRRQDWPAAASRWQAVLDGVGDRAPASAYIRLSGAHRNQGNLEGAEAALNQGRAQHPEDMALAIEHAEIATRRQDWPAAASRWQAVLDGFGDKAPASAYIRLSGAHRNQGNLEGAEAVLNQGRAQHPEDMAFAIEHAEIATRRQDWPAAASRWQAVLDGFGDKAPASAYIRLSGAHRNQGNLEGAEAALNQGRAQHPEDMAFAIEHAEIATRRQDWPAAASRWQAVLDGFGDKAPPSAYIRLSGAHRNQGNLEGAEAVLNQGRAQHPEDMAFAIEHAEIATRRQDWPAAASRWQAVLDGFGDKAPPSAYIRLSGAHRNQGNLEGAEAALNQGRAQHPEDMAFAIEHAEIATRRQDWPAAASRWQAVLDGFGDNAPANAYIRLSRAHAKAGNFDAAETVGNLGRGKHPEDMALAIEMPGSQWPARTGRRP